MSRRPGLVLMSHPQKLHKTIPSDQRRFFKQALLAQQQAEKKRDKLVKRLQAYERRLKQSSEYGIKRRLAMYGTVVNRLTHEEWEKIQERYQYLCAYCQQQLPLTQDHIVPISKGGFHTHINVIPACKSCNSRKGARPAFRYNPKLVPF